MTRISDKQYLKNLKIEQANSEPVTITVNESDIHHIDRFGVTFNETVDTPFGKKFRKISIVTAIDKKDGRVIINMPKFSYLENKDWVEKYININ